MPLTRRYETLWLNAAGQVESSTRLAPATPLFEEAFSGLARGALVQTDSGPVAVEDLLPGMHVETAEGPMQKIAWIGTMVLFPGGEGAETLVLTRLTADAMGLGKPAQDLLLGPRARVCLSGERLERRTKLTSAYVPARAFIDGVNVIEVRPAAPVHMFHIALEGQGSLKIGGLEVESYHPGEGIEQMVEPRMLSLFAGLFPHLTDLRGFGQQAHPRLTRFEVDQLLG
ncbi:Hint domain-containing protein [Thioclava sp. SK-1]|uniref:Hint domain-containing protein n=1 Tax=Thioclava sp. SK-1 TaxID=1889770 RepID=UPI00159F339F|nr:Hint domain-containing protein [Thioclava sp. SK-1]